MSLRWTFRVSRQVLVEHWANDPRCALGMGFRVPQDKDTTLAIA